MRLNSNKLLLYAIYNITRNIVKDSYCYSANPENTLLHNRPFMGAKVASAMSLRTFVLSQNKKMRIESRAGDIYERYKAPNSDYP